MKSLRLLALTAFVLAAVPVEAQQIFFTAANADEIWVANKDGSGTPSVLYSGAVGVNVLPVDLVSFFVE